MVVDSAMGKALGKGDAKEQVSTFCTSSAQHSTVLFISYEGYRIHSATLNKCQQIGLLVCDEAHRLKEGGSKTLAALAACPARARLSLTGTPVQNDLEVRREGGREGGNERITRPSTDPLPSLPPSLPPPFRNSTPWSTSSTPASSAPSPPSAPTTSPPSSNRVTRKPASSPSNTGSNARMKSWLLSLGSSSDEQQQLC